MPPTPSSVALSSFLPVANFPQITHLPRLSSFPSDLSLRKGLDPCHNKVKENNMLICISLVGEVASLKESEL